MYNKILICLDISNKIVQIGASRQCCFIENYTRIQIPNEIVESTYTYQFQDNGNTLKLHNVYTKGNVVLTKQ